MPRDIDTTLAGSYPVDIDNFDLFMKYFNKSDVDWESYIMSAVHDMTDAGLDMISDGQTRDPFLNIFFRKLKGCRLRARPEIIDKIEHVSPLIVDDQILVKKFLPMDKKLISLLAGPYTLSESCVDMFYNDKEDLAFDFAEVLNKEACILQQYVDMIGVDEPYFSVSMPEYAKDLMKVIIKDISCPIRLHVCGDVSKIIEELIDLPVDVLSHEFKASPYLVDAFAQYSFKQDICLGCVRSDHPSVESVEDIFCHIKRADKVFDGKITQVSTDCGLRTLPKDIAFQKLRNLVLAGRRYYG
jgi:5-methyltetrahydropteroyltriglutamate--homocysteine methyltransferase